MSNHREFRAAVLAALLLLGGAPFAAAAEDADWPCVQRKVPEISAGMVWAGPPIGDADHAAWREDPAIAELAQRLAARGLTAEAGEAAVAEFAAAAGADKDRNLTLLFAGILDTINGERADVLAGIERYAKRQRALAEKLEHQGAELDALPVDGTAAQQARRADLAEMQAWDTRIFMDRERALTYVCEKPVQLEQRVFALARAIQAHLD
ncbi:MAG: hypothetical protein WEC41_01775 [Dongiaceae bacterium]